MSTLQLRLFVSGNSIRSQRAWAELENLRLTELAGVPVELTTVDVLEQPEVAEQENILATPVLLKVAPLPSRQLVGDLTNRDRVLRALGVRPHPSCNGSTRG